MTTKLNSWFWPSLAALFFWGGWAFLPKLALVEISPQSVVFYEAIGNMFVTVPVFIYLKGRLVKSKRGLALTLCGSCISITALLIYFHALKIGPTATIVTLTAMYPVVGLLLARIFLKEKVNRVQLVAIAMAIAAIGLLAG